MVPLPAAHPKSQRRKHQEQAQGKKTDFAIIRFHVATLFVRLRLVQTHAIKGVVAEQNEQRARQCAEESGRRRGLGRRTAFGGRRAEHGSLGGKGKRRQRRQNPECERLAWIRPLQRAFHKREHLFVQ
jgi:hypothetical protein